MLTFGAIIVLIIAFSLLGFLIKLILKLLKTPLKIIWKLLIHALGGFLALFIINVLGGFIGVNLDFTWVNAIVVGVLGVPGAILLLIIKYI